MKIPTLLVLASLCAVPLALAQDTPETPAPARAAAAPRTQDQLLPPGRWWDGKLAESVGLTPERKKQVEQVYREHRERLTGLRSTLDQREADLRSVLDADFDSARAEAAAKAMLDARDALAREQNKVLLEVRSLLTNEQWQRLSERRQLRARPAEAEGEAPAAPAAPKAPARPAPTAKPAAPRR
ncbi:MAG: periplasmic heavy metal sensor [Acidobacteria bacterium]|nr:periplasmic heavy metal sensor [Acidobacteriota bacterium]